MAEEKGSASASDEQKSQTNEETVNDANNTDKSIEADDLNDTAKTADDDEDHNEEDDEEKKEKNKSLHIKITGFKRPSDLQEEMKLYYRFFKQAVDVEAPLVQIPSPDDKWIYFEMRSSDDKTKTFKFIRKGQWEGQRLTAKGVAIKHQNLPPKEYKKLTIEEGLEILYPNRDILYAEQLRQKTELARQAFEKLVPREAITKYLKSKKALKNVRMREAVPMTPADEYENSVTVAVEVNPETGNTDYGIRVVSDERDATIIVPLDQCLSVPRQIRIVGKKLVEALPTLDLKPYNYETKEGDIIGIAIRMTSFGNFMITLLIPKIVAMAFKELTQDGVVFKEGEEKEESYVVLVKKRVDEIKGRVDKFMTSAKTLCIDSIFLLMVQANNMLAQKDDTTPTTTHIAGQKFLAEKLNGVSIRITWERDGHLEVFRPLLSVIEAHGNIVSTTRLYLASPHRLLGLYFAKRCAHVTMFFYWSREVLIELNAWAKQLGVTNLEFQGAKPSAKKKFDNENATAIFWNFSKPVLLERFIQSGITDLMILYHWNKVVTDAYLEAHKKLLEIAYSKLRIYFMFPFDSAPMRDKFTLGIFFHGGIGGPGMGRTLAANAANKTVVVLNTKGGLKGQGKTIRALRAISGRSGINLSRAQVSVRESAFDRLGPRTPPYSRNYDSSWGKPPAPWNPPAEDYRARSMNPQPSWQSMQSDSRGVSNDDWSNKRKYPSDFGQDDRQYDSRWGQSQGPGPRASDNQYSSYDDRDRGLESYAKRRRELSPPRGPPDSGRWGGSGGESWRDQPSTQGYGGYSSSWNDTPRPQPSYYEKGRNVSNSWNSPAPNNSSWAAGSDPSSVWKAGASWNGNDAPRSYY